MDQQAQEALDILDYQRCSTDLVCSQAALAAVDDGKKHVNLIFIGHVGARALGTARAALASLVPHVRASSAGPVLRQSRLIAKQHCLN